MDINNDYISETDCKNSARQNCQRCGGTGKITITPIYFGNSYKETCSCVFESL